MQAYAKNLALVLAALAIQLTQATVARGQNDVFVSRPITATQNTNSRLVARAITVISNTNSRLVSRAFTVVNNPNNIFVSRAFTVTNNTSNIFVSRAFTVTQNTSNIFSSRAFTVVNSPDGSGCVSIDCNNNGVQDDIDIAEGTSQDVVGPGGMPDGIPDECQSDCNMNLIPDHLDIDSGFSPDCNNNGVPDDCDIFDGTSLDVVGADGMADGIPDECQSDCNGNLILDDTDIANGTSLDCNGNGIPDECDISEGTSLDGLPVGGDGIPDECQADCNGNLIPDDDDLANGTSPDCNSNAIPDECEVPPIGMGPDCNGNLIPDACEPDCNNNAVPDECDITSGVSIDDLDNVTGMPPPDGIPDECIAWSGGAGNGSWNDPANWVQGFVPGMDAANVESPVIDLAGTVVNLDIDASVDSLVIGEAVTLNINAGSLILDSPNGLRNDGSLTVADAFSILATSPTLLRGSQPIQLAGPTAAISSMAGGDTITNRGTISGQGNIDAEFVNDAGASVVATSGGTLQIAGMMSKVNDGLFEAMESGTLHIAADITGSGSYLADGGTIEIQANIVENPPGSNVAFTAQGGSIVVGMVTPSVSIDGCGPVIVIPRTGTPNQSASMSADNAFVMNASSWTIGDDQVGVNLTAMMSLVNDSVGLVNGPVTVRQNGTLVISNSSLTAGDLIVEEGGALLIGSSVTLSGSFTNGLTEGTPAAWSWATGSLLTFTGGQTASLEPCTLSGWTTLEAASEDVGPESMGGINDFGFAGLDLAAGSHVSLVDLAVNHSPAVVEAVYCDSLTLGAGAVLNLNGLNLYVAGVLLTPGPTGIGTITDERRAAGGLLGDVNDDGLFDIGDLVGFVDVLLGSDTDPVHACAADMNTDGTTDGEDIQPFIAALVLP